MANGPTIHINEFSQHTTFNGELDNYEVLSMQHPEFGRWEQKTMDLGFIKVTEHKAILKEEVNVHIDDKTLMDNVHHCMCVDGSMGAHFADHGVAADLQTGSYHYLTVGSTYYQLALSKKIHNIHLQISRSYYSDLLSDSESWSAGLKEKIHSAEVCYPGYFSVTPAMIRTVYDIFSSPLSGSLKRLMTEAKILELVALQWDSSLNENVARKGKKKQVLHDIKNFLQASFLEEHSLKSICIKFGINEFALKNGFKEAFQMTVFEFLLSCRLDHAHYLLQNADYSIQEVGSIVGYKYPNHFSTAFKNKFGISPGMLVGRN